MKVEPCCEAAVESSPKTLSFEEISEKEGIYQPCDGLSSARLITVTHPTDGAVILFFDGYKIEPACHGVWEDHHHFIKCTDEVVQFGIKKVS